MTPVQWSAGLAAAHTESQGGQVAHRSAAPSNDNGNSMAGYTSAPWEGWYQEPQAHVLDTWKYSQGTVLSLGNAE